MNRNLLKAKIVENNMTTASVAKKIKMSCSTFYRKLSGESQFNLDEANALCEVLHIIDDGEKCRIFL